MEQKWKSSSTFGVKWHKSGTKVELKHFVLKLDKITLMQEMCIQSLNTKTVCLLLLLYACDLGGKHPNPLLMIVYQLLSHYLLFLTTFLSFLSDSYPLSSTLSPPLLTQNQCNLSPYISLSIHTSQKQTHLDTIPSCGSVQFHYCNMCKHVIACGNNSMKLQDIPNSNM